MSDVLIINFYPDFSFKDEIEKKDPRGRTPLMLAIVLNHYNCAFVLLEHGANANTETDGWSGKW